MTETSVGTNVHEPLDVHGDLLAQISFHPTDGVDDSADPAHLLFGEILDPDFGTDARLIQNPSRPDPTDAIDVGKANLDALVAG
jgi:hypothetical protein